MRKNDMITCTSTAAGRASAFNIQPDLTSHINPTDYISATFDIFFFIIITCSTTKLSLPLNSLSCYHMRSRTGEYCTFSAMKNPDEVICSL